MKSLTKRGGMNEKGTLMKKVFISTFLLFSLVLGAEEKISFNEQVRPILADRCYHCHGPDAKEIKGKLQLHTEDLATQERVYKTKSGRERRRDAAIIPGKPHESIVWQRLITDDEDEIMPPIDSVAKQLTKDEKEIIRKWIEQGANYEKHWAFVPPQKKKVDLKNDDWCKNDIDRHIGRQLEDLKLQPNPEASKEQLIRRLSLDLRGTPPSLNEVDAFLADQKEGSYERLVDRILADKAVGERLAVEWLDVASYGDSQGLFEDGARSMWPWRDWVMKAFNDNKPFDQFITEQVAGDLLPNSSRDQKVATGFYRNNPVSNEGGIIDEEYLLQYAGDRVRTTSVAFLGMSLDCASCHDHKYDPLSQKNFYEMSAFFRSIDEKGKVGKGAAAPFINLPSKEQSGKKTSLEEQMAQLQKDLKAENDKAKAESILVKKVKLFRNDKSPLILTGVKFLDYVGNNPKVKASKKIKSDPLFLIDNKDEVRVNGHKAFIEFEFEKEIQISGLELRATKKNIRFLKDAEIHYFDAKGKLVNQDKILESAEVLVRKPNTKKYISLLAQLNKADRELKNLNGTIPTTLVMKERKEPRKTHILERGSYENKGEEVFPGVPESILVMDPSYPKNRLGLAKWLVDERNPLTARVTINRYWQLLFGRGIVRTAEDFGLQGDLPTNQALLDYLAVDFVENSWDLKYMIKQMVMSATYRQSSTQVKSKVQVDGENKYLSYFSRRRLDAEFIRDNALSISGLLVDKKGGRPVKPYQPAGLWKEKGNATFKQDKGEALYRKTVYTFWKRTVPHPSSVVFDATDRTTCVARRNPTNTPLQALVTLNDVQYVEAARALAQRMMLEGGSQLDQRVQFGWRLATARKANSAELALLKKEFNYRLNEYKKNPALAKERLTVGDSVQVASSDKNELASYMAVAQLLLNLDETITRN
ncbi:hypothetical protein LNTAR_13592 [Lentisphaera araneosa HTCC2155]|uniref:Chromosome segregation protein n=2 Tax=Lentisphaera TaxID=256846 RepID=A6DGX0_9BACT|nr:hypothetical protein LNTAR_13592 [Lentisphaera araneosa HTCC2155]